MQTAVAAGREQEEMTKKLRAIVAATFLAAALAVPAIRATPSAEASACARALNMMSNPHAHPDAQNNGRVYWTMNCPA